MKKFLSFFMLLCVIIFLTVLSCQKESDPKSNTNDYDISGTWVNILNSRDTIQISDSEIARRNLEVNCVCHFYKYFINNDSIMLTYIGLDKVGLFPYHKKLNLNSPKDTLIIQSLHSVYPSYEGDIFKKAFD